MIRLVLQIQRRDNLVNRTLNAIYNVGRNVAFLYQYMRFLVVLLLQNETTFDCINHRF